MKRKIDLFDAAMFLMVIVIVGASLYSIITGDSLGTNVHYNVFGRVVSAVILAIASVVFVRAYMGLRKSKARLKKLEQETEATGDR